MLAEKSGSRTHQRRLTPLTGFEVRAPHRGAIPFQRRNPLFFVDRQSPILSAPAWAAPRILPAPRDPLVLAERGPAFATALMIAEICIAVGRDEKLLDRDHLRDHRLLVKVGDQRFERRPVPLNAIGP